MDRNAIALTTYRVADAGRLTTVRAVEIDQVDIRRKVELKTTKLAHAKDGELGFLLRIIIFGVEQGGTIFGFELDAADFKGSLQGRCCQRRELICYFFELGHAAEVASADTQHLLAFVNA